MTSTRRSSIGRNSGNFPITNGVHYVSDDPSITRHNNTSIEGSLGYTLYQLGTTEATVVVPAGTYDLQANTITIKSNITLKCDRGCLIKNGTMIVDGVLVADDYKIYDSDLTVVYNKPVIVNPIHYGVVPNDESNKDLNTTLFENMMVGLPTGSILIRTPYSFYLDETWCSLNESILNELGVE